METTIVARGTFTSDGTSKIIKLPSGVDFVETRNITTITAGGAGTGVKFEWNKDLADDYAIEYTKLGADESITMAMVTSGGITYIDTSTAPAFGALNATITGISNAAIPIVSATSTATLVAGDIVQFVNVTGALQFGGIHFQIDTVNANTNFRLPYAPQIVAGTTGSFRPVNIPMQFYPKNRFISKITAANPAVITTTVAHAYEVGTTIRMNVPDVFGMTQMDGLTATITAVTASTITTDINASAFTAFAYPLTAVAALGFTPAMVSPYGSDSAAIYGGLTGNALENENYIGISLAAGTHSPAGTTNDVIHWVATKSSYEV